MSGVPGSGKTTWAHEHKPNALVISADDYFVVNGVYRYASNESHEAHVECMGMFLDAIDDGKEIVIDNTNTSVAEVSPYYMVACASGYQSTLVTLHCDPDLAFSRCVHNVPRDVIVRMHDKIKFRRLPLTWRSLEIKHVHVA